ncbi:hypothetical protein [Chlamydiifrater phoenicopteri]|uniref:hypothetical protein n=1 Tax=Chlamydiifrater phoenicopteri TaxID=2681469 RepID=UPI001BCEEA02|nr:hypothetical protein [Chlamydiifrater phoenicopteri]
MTSGVSGSGGTGGIPPFQSPGSKKGERKGGFGEHEISDTESTTSSSSSGSSRIKEAVGGAARKAIGAAKRAGGNLAKGVKGLGSRIRSGLGRSYSEGDIPSSSEASKGAGVSRSFSEGDVSSENKSHRARVAEKLKRLKEKVSATGKTIYLGFSGKKEKAASPQTTWYVDLGAGSAAPKGASRGYDPVKLPEKVVEDLRAFFQSGGLSRSSSSSSSSSASSRSSSTEDMSSRLMEQAEALMELGGGRGLEVSEGARGEKVVYAQLAIDASKKASKTSAKTEKEWKGSKEKLEKAAKDARKALDKFEKKMAKVTKALAKILVKGKEGKASEPKDDYVVRYDAKSDKVTIEKINSQEEVQYAEIIFGDKDAASKLTGSPIAARVATSLYARRAVEESTPEARGVVRSFASTVSLQTVVATQKRVLEATENTLEAIDHRGAPRTDRQAKKEVRAQEKATSELEKQMQEMRNRVQGRNWREFDRDVKKS